MSASHSNSPTRNVAGTHEDGAGNDTTRTGANRLGANDAMDAGAMDAAQQAALAAQNAAMLAAAQAHMASLHHVGFPPGVSTQQRATPTPFGYQQRSQPSFPQMQLGQQMQQGMGMLGFFPMNPFVWAQMFSPMMQFPFQTAMAPFWQQALASQNSAQTGPAVGQFSGASAQPTATATTATTAAGPVVSHASGRSTQSTSLSARTEPSAPSSVLARPDSELSDVSNPDSERLPTPPPCPSDLLAILKKAVAKLELAPSMSAKSEKKLNRVPVPNENYMEWQRGSTNRIIFRDLVSVTNVVNRFCKHHLEEEGSAERAKDFNRIGDKVQHFFDHINIAETHEEFNWELVGKALAPEVMADPDLQKRINKALTGLKQERKERELRQKNRPRFRGHDGGNGAATDRKSSTSSRHQPYPTVSHTTHCSSDCFNCRRPEHYQRDCKEPKKEK